MKSTADKSAVGAERIQKVLAAAGFGSRREIEGWITAGRVRVNGRVARLGERISATDRVALDQRPLRLERAAAERQRVILYHKPEGELTTRKDPEGRPTVFEALPRLRRSRWVSIGRLDFNTSGLLLFTNDGELANRLMHPSREIEREYAVRVLGKITEQQLSALTSGVRLDDGMAKFDALRDAGGEGANHWYHVILHEGRTREVRRLWEAVGVTVSRLIRVRYGAIALPRQLPRGGWRDATDDELQVLRTLAGTNPPAAASRVSASRPRNPQGRSRVRRRSHEKDQD
ncbi:MAG: 23S rRNA pseudouridine(2605) synthase RluB [Gammaproteobacteria bacterium]|nr:23S rRNA pseudouridine(2605) synthase RluB [Gammaproteobacteria bacterium]